jgi:DNA-binding NtrC family response regulator
MQTIYILDYDIDIVMPYLHGLKRMAMWQSHFSTLEQLLLHLQTQQPDFIILDCLFGRVTLTSEVCHTLQNMVHYKGKILLTSTSAISAKDLKVCNASAFIPKPFDFGKILWLVNEMANTSLAESLS